MSVLIPKRAKPDQSGNYIVGFDNSPVLRVVSVSSASMVTGKRLVHDSDYPVGLSVEEYGAAWYVGPFDLTAEIEKSAT